MKVYTNSQQGKRGYQEDRFLVKPLEEKTRTICAVSDGMGGHPNGDKAAEKVVFHVGLAAKNLDEIVGALWAANIECLAEKDHRGATATVCLFDTDKNTISVAHAGDTRISHFPSDPQGSAGFLTVDHGIGSMLKNAVGFLSVVDNFELPIYPGCFVISSDGVHDFMNLKEMDTEITNAIECGEDPAKALCDKALRNGSSDNCTAIVVDLSR